MTKSEEYLQWIQTIAANGFEVNALASLRQELSEDLSSETHAAVMWALTETSDPTTIWWMGYVAQRSLRPCPYSRKNCPTYPIARDCETTVTAFARASAT
jgi:hypothetical protein